MPDSSRLALRSRVKNVTDQRARDLEATVAAMRRALELAQREADGRLQEERARAAAEIDQLQATVAELRRELEGRQVRHAEALLDERGQTREEIKQLQATIQAMRDELEAFGR